MTGYLQVFLKIAAILLVILVGWVARRREVLSADATTRLSRFIVDFAMPALIVAHMLRTVNGEMLRESWHYPLIGMGVVLLGGLLALPCLPLVKQAGTKRTFVLTAAMTNWLYLPLVLVESLLAGEVADRAVAAILLFNLGIMPLFWTLGVWTLRGGKLDRKLVLDHLLVPGFIATIIGVVVPVIFPQAAALQSLDVSTANAGTMVGSTLVQAMALLGSVALPMSLVLIGSQLGGMKLARPTAPAWIIVLLRLIAVPLVVLGLFYLAARAGWDAPWGLRFVSVLVAAMPVGVTCPILIERFGGDRELAAEAVALSTVCSVLTVPLVLQAVGELPWG